jgi:uncharacterized membrane protein
MREETPQAVPQEVVPRPEVGACYSHGWRQLKAYALEVFLVTIVALIIGLPGYALMDASDEMGHGNDVLGVIGLIYLVLLTRPLKYGAFLVFYRAARNRQVVVKEMFEVSQNYLNVVLANLFVLVIVAVGIVFFIIPGIYLAIRLSFTPFLVADRKMEAVEAVKESWRLTAGHSWTILLIALVAVPISILGLACLGVGLIGAMMWVGMAHASLYYAVTSSREAGLQGAGAGSTQAPQ